MKYQFILEGDEVRLCLIPKDDLEKSLLKRIFEKGEVKVDLPPNMDDVIIKNGKDVGKEAR